MDNFRDLLILCLFLAGIGCREALVSSDDERKETLIIGAWTLQSSDPPREGSISLFFSSDVAEHVVHIVVVNAAGTSEFDFNYRIEDGDLYFLTIVGQDQEVEFVYDIEELTEFSLVLSFTESSGLPVTQTYVRP